MQADWIAARSVALAPRGRGYQSASVAILVAGAALFWLSVARPSLMPVWAPWDFSPVEYLATAFTLLWFVRGLARTPREARLPVWRRVVFLLGLAAIYAVLQTRIEYWAQHMFFLNRMQHVVMHHLGPLLIALAGVGETLERGLPAWARRVVDARAARAVVRVLQQPFLAATLFVGLFYFWLIPNVHFWAMIDAPLYAIMNWSMVIDGLLFWSLVLDRRPMPPARLSFGARAALSLGVMFPQIVLGSLIAFSQRDLYPYYDLCGRLFPQISATYDQHLGGLIIWIPPAMMSAVGVILVLNALRIHEDSIMETDDEAVALSALARSWTGR